MRDKDNELNRIFSLARAKGLCHTQGEFSRLLGMNPSTISGAMQGKEKFLTDNLIRRVQLWARQVGLEEAPKRQEPDIVIPAATAALYNNMSETIRIQAELIARLQGPQSVSYAGTYAPKNYRAEK